MLAFLFLLGIAGAFFSIRWFLNGLQSGKRSA